MPLTVIGYVPVATLPMVNDMLVKVPEPIVQDADREVTGVPLTVQVPSSGANPPPVIVMLFPTGPEPGVRVMLGVAAVTVNDAEAMSWA